MKTYGILKHSPKDSISFYVEGISIRCTCTPEDLNILVSVTDRLYDEAWELVDRYDKSVNL